MYEYSSKSFNIQSGGPQKPKHSRRRAGMGHYGKDANGKKIGYLSSKWTVEPSSAASNSGKEESLNGTQL
jgi:hypothetical protein